MCGFKAAELPTKGNFLKKWGGGVKLHLNRWMIDIARLQYVCKYYNLDSEVVSELKCFYKMEESRNKNTFKIYVIITKKWILQGVIFLTGVESALFPSRWLRMPERYEMECRLARRVLAQCELLPKTLQSSSVTYEVVKSVTNRTQVLRSFRTDYFFTKFFNRCTEIANKCGFKAADLPRKGKLPSKIGGGSKAPFESAEQYYKVLIL
ncbi:hypothetical protein HUJ04_011110 [Dendroctonus ponderosae]|nr:hypothetical protein HUJ04_011110 [Dendroctonus ponderosae]